MFPCTDAMRVIAPQPVRRCASVLMFAGFPTGVRVPLEGCGDGECGVKSSFHIPYLLILLEGLTTACARPGH